MVTKTARPVGLSDIPLKQLWAFESVFRNGSMSAASAELSVTPSAISHRIAKLEEALGRRLFARVRNGVAPSAQGIEFAELVMPALNDLSAVGQKVSALAACALDIHACAGFPSAAVLTRLPEFLSSMGAAVKLSWSVVRHETSLSRTDADVCLHYSEKQTDSGNRGEQLVLLRAPRHPPLPCEFTLLRGPEPWDEWWEKLTGIRLTSGACVSFGDPLAMLHACTLGLGVCIAPFGLATGYLANASLVLAQAEWASWASPDVYLTARGRRKVVARQFAAWARSVLSSTNDDEAAAE